MPRTGNNYEKWLRGENTVNIQDYGSWVQPFPSSPSINIYTKFDLNVKSSFKVIYRTRYWDGWMDKVATICFPLWGA